MGGPAAIPASPRANPKGGIEVGGADKAERRKCTARLGLGRQAQRSPKESVAKESRNGQSVITWPCAQTKELHARNQRFYPLIATARWPSFGTSCRPTSIEGSGSGRLGDHRNPAHR